MSISRPEGTFCPAPGWSRRMSGCSAPAAKVPPDLHRCRRAARPRAVLHAGRWHCGHIAGRRFRRSVILTDVGMRAGAGGVEVAQGKAALLYTLKMLSAWM